MAAAVQGGGPKVQAAVEGLFLPEVGKVTFKSNRDEALSDEFLLKSNGDEASNNVFP